MSSIILHATAICTCGKFQAMYLDPLTWVGHHQVTVDERLCVLAQALDNGCPQCQVVDKVAVLRSFRCEKRRYESLRHTAQQVVRSTDHNVDMQPISSETNHFLALISQHGEICRKDGWRNYGCWPVASGSFGWQRNSHDDWLCI